MRRRDFLKTLALAALGSGILPAVGSADFVEFCASSAESHEEYLQRYLQKMRHFNEPHPEDIYLDRDTCIRSSRAAWTEWSVWSSPSATAASI